MIKKINLLAVAVAMTAAGAAGAATLSGVGTYEGKAGVGSANGDVGANAYGNKYLYVTTHGSSYTKAGLGIGSETNGSELTTYSFTANAGDKLSYYFNYVTSDGTSNYVEYAYAKLNDISGAGANNALIFTARTNPDNTQPTVPGFGLPAIDPSVTLDPAQALIQNKLTKWSELGSSSGTCFNVKGCGSTGWVKSTMTIANAGTYSLTFGVVNWNDTSYDSGLAIAGIKVGDDVIVDPNDPSAVPLPASGLLLLAGFSGLAAARRRKKA